MLFTFVGISTIKKPRAMVRIPANFIPVNSAASHCPSITERKGVDIYVIPEIFESNIIT